MGPRCRVRWTGVARPASAAAFLTYTMPHVHVAAIAGGNEPRRRTFKHGVPLLRAEAVEVKTRVCVGSILPAV